MPDIIYKFLVSDRWLSKEICEIVNKLLKIISYDLLQSLARISIDISLYFLFKIRKVDLISLKEIFSLQSGFSCLSFRPGIPGVHGKPGVPGRDGRDGREGIEGKRGPRGFQGSPGSQGRPGSPGNDGKPGARGPQGLKGDTGPKGDKGDRGPRGLSSDSNWKECSWKTINGGKDNGLLKVCVICHR